MLQLTGVMNATWEWIIDVYLKNKEIGNIELLVTLSSNVIWLDLSDWVTEDLTVNYLCNCGIIIYLEKF
jgi:hypothetical protein